MATTCLPFVKPWEELFREGAAAYADRDFAVAADCYQQAIQLAPESAAAHYNLGNVLLELENPGEAVRCYLAAIRLDAQLPDAWNNLGIAYLTLHDEQAARQAWLLCRTLAPWRTDCLFNLADLATVTGDLQQAASLWEEFLRREPVGEVADHARHRLHALQAASAINRP